MGSTKLCSKCGCEKPYFPEEKKNSKASGFNGAVCWNCYLAANREIQQKIRATEEGRKKANAANQKTRATPEGRKKANAATVKCITARRKRDAWFRLKMQLNQETNKLLKELAVGKGTDYMCFKIFGKSRKTAFAYIDAQLTARGFKWEGHGTEWQLDHRKPLGLAQSSIELYQLCLLENTEVLTPEENMKKSAEDQKLIREFEASQA